ncbi:helix-turn-helix domain-containing protein [Actinopolyspora mortivallis]|uniref:helix-turn-helix domain-containing protein n=1 Tax=Actinopolyspora mortivallis TaxID=33906 RepID=UPI0003803EBA|nr:helix-turn-helix domain-containing protein [Actinopolyspora mortivallis]
MTTQDAVPGDELLELLELLAEEASPTLLERWAQRLRREHTSVGILEHVDRARNLALRIRGSAARPQQRAAGMAALVDIARELALPHELGTLLKLITKRARLLLNLDMSWISLHSEDEDCSYVRAADGHASTITVGFRVPSDGGVGNEATRHCAPFWSSNYLSDDRFPHSGVIDEVVRAEKLCSILAVPLQDVSTSLGSLYVASRESRSFSTDEITLLSSLGELATVAIEKTRALDRTRAEVSELRTDTTEAVHTSQAMRRIYETHSALLDLVLRGESVHSLVTEAAEKLGGTLLVSDTVGNVLASTGDIPEIADFEHHWISTDVSEQHHPCQPITGVWSCPVAAGSEQFGTLVLRPNETPDEHELRLLRLVAQTVAMLLLIQRSTAVAEGQLREELFEDLLSSPWLSPQQHAERARRLSINLNEPHVIVVARPEGKGHGRAAGWASSYAARWSGLKSVRGDNVVLLLPGAEAGAVARSVSRELSELLGHPVTVGAAGPFSEPARLPDTYQEAMRCLDALTALGNTGHAAAAGELGFVGMLLSDNHDVDGFIRTTIGPVLDYDSAQSTELVRTLRAYFESGSSPTNAAEALHVHPNTVSRRLERVTTLLGPNWQHPERSLEIQLALRLQRTRHTLRGPEQPTSLTGHAGSGVR